MLYSSYSVTGMLGGRWQAAAGRFGFRYPWLSAYLTRRIDYFGGEVLPSILDYLAECILNGRVVALHKVAFDEADRQR